jgi:ELWxxDGT repeat protein
MGNTIAAAGSIQTYSVSPAADATSYGWFLPTGYTGSSTTNIITVTIGTVSDFIGVAAQNSCGWSLQASILPITVSGCAVPNQPGAIAGNTTVNSGSIETYSTSPVVGATSYIWTLPSGYTGSSTSNSISVTIGTTNGVISVVSQNSCGLSPANSLQLSVPGSTATTQVSLCQPYLFKSIESQIFCNINGIMLIGVQYDGLWRSDGTPAGTVKINAAPQYITGPFAVLGNTAYFKSAMQIWKSDGTESGTVMVMDIPNASLLGPLVPAGNFVFFRVQFNGSIANKLWKTDGTTAGTSLVKDIDPTNSSSWDPRYLFAYNNNVYFKAGNSTYGMELWKSDGTNVGTVVVKDAVPGSGDGSYASGYAFAIYNNELYSHGGNSSGAISYGLWKTDGTAPGTMLVKATSFMRDLTEINGLLYFYAFDQSGLYGEELWRSDGTPAGTYMVKDIKLGSGSGVSSGSKLENINGKIVFGASDGTTGIELWASDGTAGGTQLLKDIFPGTSGSLGNYFMASDAINGYIYFGADNGTVGRELWATDGTSSGTFLVSDIWQGINGSSPWGFHIFNGNLYYTVYGNFDNSLWSCGNFVGIQKIQDNQTVSIYPNPSSGIFKIKSDELLKDTSVKIYNTQGQTIFESKRFISEIDLSNQPKGIYFIQIKSEYKIVTKKIILQ